VRDVYAWQVYTIFLDLALLVVPLTLMVAAYGRIALTLMHGFRQLNADNATRRQCYQLPQPSFPSRTNALLY